MSQSLELNSIGNKIRTLRKRKNLSQLELAKQIGCAQNTVAEWEKRDGRIPGRRFLVKVASVLNVSVDHLMGKEKEDEQRIQCYGEIDSNGFIWNKTKISYYIEISSSIYQETMFALKIIDDTLEPVIQKGDYGIFVKNIPQDGDIIAVRFPKRKDFTIVKRLRRIENWWMLSEINVKKICDPYFFNVESINGYRLNFQNKDKIESVFIEGKLVIVKKDPKAISEKLGIKYTF